MGYHMGPDFQRDVGGHYDAYHQEKLVCCQLNNPIQMQINNLQNKNPGSCIYAMVINNPLKSIYYLYFSLLILYNPA